MADEVRKAAKKKYEEILGRNFYSQNATKRQCVYTPHSDGRYYSDCSSSILNTLFAVGAIDFREGNTATIHAKGTLVDVNIKRGVPEESALRIGDCLLFRGEDASRPEKIGHVEMYAGNNTLYGHGSSKPSVKDMTLYCKSRAGNLAVGGWDKGLVEVRRFIPDDDVIIPISGVVKTTADLNIRSGPNLSSPIIAVLPKGTSIKTDAKSNRWFRVPRGWVSAQYLTGWVREGDRWWYLLPGYTWPSKTVMTIGAKDYAFDADGWMVDRSRIDINGAICYD